MLFKKSKAIYIKKMNCLNEVTVSEQGLKLQLNYSSIDLKLEDIPKLMSDVTQLYALAKPLLDSMSEEANAEAEKKVKDGNDETFEPIDLSNIPF